TEGGLVALEHHTAHAGIGLGGHQGVGQRGVHRGGDRVLLVWAVEGQRGDAGFGVDEDVAHGRFDGVLRIDGRSPTDRGRWPAVPLETTMKHVRCLAAAAQSVTAPTELYTAPARRPLRDT